MMEKTALIVVAGEFPKKEYPRYVISMADYVVCCDSAFKTWLRVYGNTRLPDVVIGDMDSLGKNLQERYKGLIVKVDEQDNNDQTKAFKYILDNFKDVSKVYIVGGSGKREDHTVGNMSLLMEYTRMFDLNGVSVEMISDTSTIFPITDSCELYLGEGRGISIFSPDNSLKIKSEGLKWKTDDVVFDNWWKATLNKADRDVVKLTFSHKSLALIVLS